MVRLEPRYPPPPVDFDEWDGLLRILFVRKNKTCAASFKTTSVLELLEHNYKTVQSLQGGMVPLVFDFQMEEDLDVKGKVMEVLHASGFAESRPAKMDNDDFLKLLSMFIDAGFRFTSK